MNKKGYTLVEIIICLTLIILIGASSLIIVNKNKKKDVELTETIVLAGKVYVDNEQYIGQCILIDNLIDKGYLKEEEYNSFKNKYLRIIKDENGLNEINIVDDCHNRFEVVLDNGDGLENNKIYLEYGINWYEDSDYNNVITQINVPTKVGYKFDGYYIDINDSNTKIVDEDGSILVNNTYFNSDATIYAKWSIATYEVYLCGAKVEVQSGVTKTLSPNLEVSGSSSSSYRSNSCIMKILKGDNNSSKLNVKIGVKTNFSGYAASAWDDDCIFKYSLYQSGILVNSYQETYSCITMSGRTYSNGSFYNKTINFNEDNEIVFTHKVEFLSKAIGDSNVFTLANLTLTLTEVE